MGNGHPSRTYVEVRDSYLSKIQCSKCSTRIPGLKYAAQYRNLDTDIDVIFFYQFAPGEVMCTSAFCEEDKEIHVIKPGTAIIQMLECTQDQDKYFCCRCVSNNPVFVRLAFALGPKAAFVNDDMSKYWIGPKWPVKGSLPDSC